MKIVITGGRGFIGAHLARALRPRHDLVITDRLDADLAIPYEHGWVIRNERPDLVMHLGARYGRLLCEQEPHRAVAENAAGTTEIAAECAEWDIPIVYASSSEVYGDHGYATITEDSELLEPTTIYGLSKRWGEESLWLYDNDALIVRMNMVYGPAQRGDWGCCALAQFIQKAIAGEPFEVHRDTSRSWLYIDDAVDALVKLIEGGHRGTFNLGNDREMLPMEMVGAMVDRNLMRMTDPPAGQIRHKVYDVSKLREAIDWEPRTTLAVGINRTMNYERKVRHGEKVEGERSPGRTRSPTG